MFNAEAEKEANLESHCRELAFAYYPLAEINIMLTQYTYPMQIQNQVYTYHVNAGLFFYLSHNLIFYYLKCDQDQVIYSIDHSLVNVYDLKITIFFYRYTLAGPPIASLPSLTFFFSSGDMKN